MSTQDVGDAVVVSYEVRDDEGELVDAGTVVLTVTLPDLTTVTPAVDHPDVGEYEVTYLLAAAGRHIFTWVSTAPNTAESEVIDAEAIGNLPSLVEVTAYLGATSATQAQITEALAAETAAQAAVCRVGAHYPADLSGALKRRVARNLALKGIPLAVLQGDPEAGSLVLPGRDPEVRRLEGPYRPVVFA